MSYAIRIKLEGDTSDFRWPDLHVNHDVKIFNEFRFAIK